MSGGATAVLDARLAIPLGIIVWLVAVVIHLVVSHSFRREGLLRQL